MMVYNMQGRLFGNEMPAFAVIVIIINRQYTSVKDIGVDIGGFSGIIFTYRA